MKRKSKQKAEKQDMLEAYKDVTVADMNVEGMRGYKTPEEKKRAEEMEALKLSKSEHRAMLKGAYAAMLPSFLIGLLVFCATFGLLFLLLYFWSRP